MAAFNFSLITLCLSASGNNSHAKGSAKARVRSGFISSKDGINVLLIEPLLHQIKVPADGLAHAPPSDMKGIISIHYFTLCNIPIINELQPRSCTRSIMAAVPGPD